MGIQVAKQGDFGAVMDRLAVDVQDEGSKREVGERAFGGADR